MQPSFFDAVSLKRAKIVLRAGWGERIEVAGKTISPVSTAMVKISMEEILSQWPSNSQGTDSFVITSTETQGSLLLGFDRWLCRSIRKENAYYGGVCRSRNWRSSSWHRVRQGYGNIRPNLILWYEENVLVKQDIDVSCLEASSELTAPTDGTCKWLTWAQHQFLDIRLAFEKYFDSMQWFILYHWTHLYN